MLSNEVKTILKRIEIDCTCGREFLYYRLPGWKAPSRILLPYEQSNRVKKLVKSIRRRQNRNYIYKKPAKPFLGYSAWAEFVRFLLQPFSIAF